MLAHLGPMALVGASLGEFAALGAAARWPELVTAIALIDALPNLDAEVVEGYLAPILAARADAQSALVQNILDRVDELGAWTASFVGPLLLVRGENSPLGPDLADRLGVACPHLTVAPIEGAGHVVARDQPTRLAQVLDDFL